MRSGAVQETIMRMTFVALAMALTMPSFADTDKWD